MTIPQRDSYQRRDDAVTRTSTLRRHVLAVAVSGIFAASVAAFSTVASGDEPSTDGVIKTLSARPNLVSGGNVLVQVTLRHENGNHPMTITLNGHDVTSAFHPGNRANTLIGLVTGLKLGKNTLRAAG